MQTCALATGLPLVSFGSRSSVQHDSWCFSVLNSPRYSTVVVRHDFVWAEHTQQWVVSSARDLPLFPVCCGVACDPRRTHSRRGNVGNAATRNVGVVSFFKMAHNCSVSPGLQFCWSEHIDLPTLSACSIFNLFSLWRVRPLLGRHDSFFYKMRCGPFSSSARQSRCKWVSPWR